MHKQNGMPLGKNKVWTARQVWGLYAEPKTARMKTAPDHHFRVSVAIPDTTHIVASHLGAVYVPTTRRYR
jgi:hypothetical protein